MTDEPITALHARTIAAIPEREREIESSCTGAQHNGDKT